MAVELSLGMDAPIYTLSVTHLKTQQSAMLELTENRIWLIGREDGSTTRLDKWAIDFDSALSRDHLQIKLEEGILRVEGTRNRHPILFEGTPVAQLRLLPGQGFSTARLRFLFQKQGSPEELVGEMDLLCLTAVFSILFNAGVGFGRIFLLLNPMCSKVLKAALDDIEIAVMQRGELLSKALASHPRIFQEYYIGMVEVGEAGDLGAALERLYRQLLADMQLRDEKLICRFPIAFSAACINLAELLEAGSPEAKAFSMAAKATTRADIKQALLKIANHLEAGEPFEQCEFSKDIPQLLVSMMLTYHSLGKLPLAFREFAKLLALPPAPIRATGELSS